MKQKALPKKVQELMGYGVLIYFNMPAETKKNMKEEKQS